MLNMITVSQPLCIGSHEVYDDCGSACPATCDNYNGPASPCIDVCVEGCFCEAGYVKNSADICVLPSECPGISLISCFILYTQCYELCLINVCFLSYSTTVHRKPSTIYFLRLCLSSHMR